MTGMMIGYGQHATQMLLTAYDSLQSVVDNGALRHSRSDDASNRKRFYYKA